MPLVKALVFALVFTFNSSALSKQSLATGMLHIYPFHTDVLIQIENQDQLLVVLHGYVATEMQ